MNKRDRIIALSVCSIIFVAVLILGILTASGVTKQKKTVKNMQSGTEQAPTVLPPEPLEEPAVQEPPAPPRPARRYKLADTPENYGEFDYSSLKKLPPQLQEQKLRAGILVDLNTRQVLWEKSSRRPVPIASITKLLTLYTAFEELVNNGYLILKDGTKSVYTFFDKSQKEDEDEDITIEVPKDKVDEVRKLTENVYKH